MIDIAMVIVASCLAFIIRKQKLLLESLGVETSQPILRIYVFPLVQIMFFSVNMIFKYIDNLGWYGPEKNSNAFVNFIWQTMNLIYPLEGLFVFLLFLHYYLPYLKRNLSDRMYASLNFIGKLVRLTLCLRIDNVRKVFHFFLRNATWT
jgi:hypothetical protein